MTTSRSWNIKKRIRYSPEVPWIALVSCLMLAAVLFVPSKSMQLPGSQLASIQVQEGVGVDSCAAGSWTPSQAQWLWNNPLPADGYTPSTIGGYIGGVGSNPNCTDINSTWASDISAGLPGWGIIPIYVGYQAPSGCGTNLPQMSIDPSTALSQGETDANQAASLAKSAGFTDVVYDDMEGYDYTSSCDSAVTSYLNGWVYQLNQDGLVAGVYGSADSTIAGLVGHIGDSGMHEPAYIWTGSGESLWNISSVPNSDWLNDQRDVQYGSSSGDGMSWDSDCIDAGSENGMAESTWDNGSLNDSGSSEGNSVSYDYEC